jgi:hypothetical protein
MEERHRDPSKCALEYIYINLEFIFKGFLDIMGSLRFQWGLLITLGFEPEEPLIKKGKTNKKIAKQF